MPSHGKTVWGIVEDLLNAPEIRRWRSALQMHMLAADEYQVLTLDGTLKIFFLLWTNQSAYGPPAVGTPALGTHKVLTVRG